MGIVGVVAVDNDQDFSGGPVQQMSALFGVKTWGVKEVVGGAHADF